jgi:TonB family protein
VKALVLVPMLLALVRPELAFAGDDSLAVRFAVVVGSRDVQARDFGQVLDDRQMSDNLSSWDPNSDNPEIGELFALRGLNEVTRQAARVPAAGGSVAGGAKIGDVYWRVELDVRAAEEHPRIDARIFRAGELYSAPSIITPYGVRALVSVTSEETDEQYFVVVQVDRSASVAGNGNSAVAADTHPKLVHRVNPEYPASERASKVEGIVVLVLRVELDGQVGDARVERGLGRAFDDAALEAVRQWRFEPARRAGRAVTAEYRVTIRFVPGPDAEP